MKALLALRAFAYLVAVWPIRVLREKNDRRIEKDKGRILLIVKNLESEPRH